MLGSIFRGLGDSRTPLITVAIACAFNVIGDLLFVAVFRMSAAGAALATVMAQALSVVISIFLIRRKGLSFSQSLSAFVAQNVGAGDYERAKKSMQYAMSMPNKRG